MNNMLLNLLGAYSVLSGRVDPLRGFALVNMLKQENAAQEQAGRDQFAQEKATNTLFRTSGQVGMPERRAIPLPPDVLGGRTIGGKLNPKTGAMENIPEQPLLSEQNRMALTRRAAPAQFDAATIAANLPKPRLAGKDRFIGTPGEGGVFDLETQTVLEGTRTGPAPSALAKLQAELDAMAPDDPRRPTWQAKITRESSGEPQQPERVWRVIPKEEAVKLGLPEGGTYKTNGVDVQVVVQPKQERPTAGENTAAYHGRRLATALGTLNEVLSKNPEAATSLVPGNNVASKWLRGEDGNRVQAALPEIGDALLTLGTGAAYTKEQFQQQWTANLPAVGDSDQVLADKFGRVQALYNQAKENAGPTGEALPSIDSLAAIYQRRAAGSQQAARPQTQEDFDKLQSGALYIDPDDNRQYRKP